MAHHPIQPSVANVSPTFRPANEGGDTFPNDGNVFLLINAPGPVTMTVRSPHAGREDYTQEHTGTSFNSDRFDPVWWNDPATGWVTFEFDDPTGVSVAAIRIPVVLADPTSPGEPGLF